MYTTSWCGDCRAAKYFLNEKNIPYVEINIENGDGAAEIVMQANQWRAVGAHVRYQSPVR